MDVHFALNPFGAFFIAQNLTCGIVQKTGGNIMHDLKDRLKEPSSYAGLAAVFQGVGECLKGDYATGVPLIVLGLLGVFKKEQSIGAK
jgi:hypothetical protein